MIRLKFVELRFDPALPLEERISNVFPDGREWGAYPHEEAHYHVIAHRCGYQGDLWAYAWEHEFAHSFLAERLADEPSYVLRCMVNGDQADPFLAMKEEAAVQMFQRWLRANERPIIGGVPWDEMKRLALRYLDPLNQGD